MTDTRSVLDQAVRVLNAMVDIAAGFGLLETTVGLLSLHQMIVQASNFRLLVVSPGEIPYRTQIMPIGMPFKRGGPAEASWPGMVKDIDLFFAR